MSKERKYLLWSIITAIIYLPLDYFASKNIDTSSIVSVPEWINFDVINIISYVIYGIGIIYLCILTFNKNINLSNHKIGILIWSIYFIISNIITGILGIIAYSKIDNRKKDKKRELPEIKYEEFTNKYLCLAAFVICMIIMFFISDYINGFWPMVIMYVVIFGLMISVFYKQLIHDFKIFKNYFKEYMGLIVKTWLKSLFVMVLLGIILQLITNTTQSNNQQTLQKMFKIYPVFIALLSTLYAPFAEELMFRGVFRKFINSKYLFILVSGILFGLIHVIDDSKTLAEFSYIIVYSSLGMFLASLYYKTNNLWTNITFHFLQNALGVIGMLIIYLVG